MDQRELIKKITSSKILLDVLVAFEDFLDNNDLYAFRNWIKGEIIAGPFIERYWVTVILKYPYKCMPDPEGAQRLVDQGVKVRFKKHQQEFYYKDLQMSDSVNVTGLGFTQQTTMQTTPKPEIVPLWLVEMTMPRRFVEDIIEQDLEDYEGTIDLEDISDARDANIDAESAMKGDTGDEEDELGDLGEEGGEIEL